MLIFLCVIKREEIEGRKNLHELLVSKTLITAPFVITKGERR